jgi:hypothetical protein
MSQLLADIEWGEIDGVTYLFDTLTGFRHDEAKRMCESNGMTLLTFEGGEKKWNSINNYLVGHGKTRYSLAESKLSN